MEDHQCRRRQHNCPLIRKTRLSYGQPRLSFGLGKTFVYELSINAPISMLLAVREYRLIKRSRFSNGYLDLLVRVFVWDFSGKCVVPTLFSHQTYLDLIHIHFICVSNSRTLPRPIKQSIGLIHSCDPLRPGFRVPSRAKILAAP